MSKPDKTLFDLFADLWRAKVYVLTGVVVGCMAAFAFGALATPHYKAQMIVSPANPMNGAEVSSLLADDNLFALRYLVQRVGVANSSDFIRFENMYDGPSVAQHLLKDEKILKGLRYDRNFDAWQRDQDWSAGRLAEYIGERVHLEPVGATSLRKMVYHHPNREFATYFLHHIHGLTDALIRSNIRTDAESRVKYLEEAVQASYNPEHKRALTTLLLEQERLRMLVSIEQPYAAAIIEPPAAGIKPAWPNPLLVFPVFIFVGAFLGFVIWNFVAGGEAAAKETVDRRKKVWFKTNAPNANQKQTDEERWSAEDAAE